MIIDELVNFSNLYGSNEEFVLAGGGNTSAKDGDIMYIKGSGTSLATITADSFVKMDRKKLAEIFTKVYPNDDKERESLSLKDLSDAKLPGQEDKRPSVETTLHSLFEFKFVLHLHPTLVNGLTCSLDGKSKAKELFGDSVIWIEPVRPGYVLAKTCHDILEDYKNTNGKPADMVLLANHGVFVAADTVPELGEKLGLIIGKLSGAVKKEADMSTGAFDAKKSQDAFNIISDIFGEESVITFDPSAEVIGFTENDTSVSKLIKPFNPDQIVYCKPYPVYAKELSDIEPLVNDYKDSNGFLPKIILVKDAGLFAVDYSVKGSETAANLFNDAIKIAVYAESFGGARPMSDELTDFIVNWEAESYRSKQN